MVLNALDEVLFWEDIDILKLFVKQNLERFYPHDREGYRKNSEMFFKSAIPSKDEFIRRLKVYKETGAPVWISGRNGLGDDIDTATMVKAISVNSKIGNGERKAAQASKWLENNPSFWSFYVDNILNLQENRILELTVGAGGGTNAVMSRMTDRDYYMGVDIDFVCAKNADALAKFYSVNGLGLVASLWNLPFEDCMFTSVCCNAGLEECREIPTIIREAHRVLITGGKFVLHCLHENKIQSYSRYKQFGFSEEEILYWSKKIRMYSSAKDTELLLINSGFKRIDQIDDDNLGFILVYEK